MNTHDIDIKLPPLPLPGPYGYEPNEIRAWARAAIEADRQRRGEPAAAQHDAKEEYLAMEAVMESVNPATWPGLTAAQRCALGRFMKPVTSTELAKSLPDLIVTKGGVPFEDQIEGIRQFKAACLKAAPVAQEQT